MPWCPILFRRKLSVTKASGRLTKAGSDTVNITSPLESQTHTEWTNPSDKFIKTAVISADTDAFFFFPFAAERTTLKLNFHTFKSQQATVTDAGGEILGFYSRQ